MASELGGLRGFVRDNSLSLALFALFAACLALQTVTGWSALNSTRQELGFPKLGWAQYLGTGDFLDGMMSNWQAAVLQLAVLIAFSSVLRQRGAAHSKKLAHGDPDALDARTVMWKFHPRESLGEWLYANSLSLVFFTSFAVTLALHSVFGLMRANEERALERLDVQTWPHYVASADFWVTQFQTWEAEFFAIGFYVVLSIFLRQESSPESKPVGASDDDTGETNH